MSEVDHNELVHYELVAEHNASLNYERKELATINKELDKLIQAIINGVSAISIKDKINALEARKEALTANDYYFIISIFAFTRLLAPLSISRIVASSI